MKTDKRQLLLNTALKLFVENGFHGTATARIAKEAGLPNGTLFQHFPTKEALILAVYQAAKDDLAAFNSRQDGDKSVREKIKTEYVLSVAWAVENISKFQYILQFYNSPYVRSLDPKTVEGYVQPHLHLLAAGIAEGSIRPLATDLLLQLITSHTNGVVQYLSNQNAQSQEEVIETTFSLLWDMIKK